MGAGVAGALKKRGGAVVEQEAMAQGPVDPGECVVTSAGRLQARYVIHAAVMGQDLQTSGPLIELATRNALLAAEGLEAAVVAFPAFGTGVGGFPLDECARLMIGEVRRHAPEAQALRIVRFVVFGQHAFRVFEHVAQGLLGGSVH
jgi:O-acetyl-ADP-ribose deacetylase (regulator of RNase III)